jgi:hypothetical protein
MGVDASTNYRWPDRIEAGGIGALVTVVDVDVGWWRRPRPD